MKIIDLYRKNKERFLKYVILIKVGVFYETYNEDCYILNNLFGYKIKNIGDYCRVDFPINSYSKVIEKLDKTKINYLVIGDEIVKRKFNKNQYDCYVKADLNIDKRIDEIYKKLKGLKLNSNISAILNKIEGILWLKS